MNDQGNGPAGAGDGGTSPTGTAMFEFDDQGLLVSPDDTDNPTIT